MVEFYSGTEADGKPELKGVGERTGGSVRWDGELGKHLPMKAQTAIVPVEGIVTLIRPARGQRVILDTDLASLYGVPTSRFNEAVKRNLDRFPEDFHVSPHQVGMEIPDIGVCDLKQPQNSRPLPLL